MSKDKKRKAEHDRGSRDRLKFLVEMSQFPWQGFTVHEDVDGISRKDPEERWMLYIRDSADFHKPRTWPAIYGSTLEETIDKAIRRKKILERHSMELEREGFTCSYFREA